MTGKNGRNCLREVDVDVLVMKKVKRGGRTSEVGTWWPGKVTWISDYVIRGHFMAPSQFPILTWSGSNNIQLTSSSGSELLLDLRTSTLLCDSYFFCTFSSLRSHHNGLNVAHSFPYSMMVSKSQFVHFAPVMTYT